MGVEQIENYNETRLTKPSHRQKRKRNTNQIAHDIRTSKVSPYYFQSFCKGESSRRFFYPHPFIKGTTPSFQALRVETWSQSLVEDLLLIQEASQTS